MGIMDTISQKESLKMCSVSSGGCHSDGRFENFAAASKNVASHSSSSAPPKFKRRKVSAKRDFPPGCGRNVVPIPRSSEQVACLGGTVQKEMNMDVSSAFQKQLCENGSKSQDMEVEMLPQPNHSASNMEMPVSMSVDLETAKGLVCEVSDVLKDLHQVDAAAAVVNIKPKKIFPKRKVSARRDFPLYCGRNAPPLPEEERMRVMSLRENKSLEKEDGVVANDLRIEEKQVTEIAQDGGVATEDRMAGDFVELTGDLLFGQIIYKITSEIQELASKEMEEQGALGACSGKGIDQGEKRIHFSETNQSEFANKATVVAESQNADPRGVEENRTQDIVLYEGENAERDGGLKDTMVRDIGPEEKLFLLSSFKDRSSEGNHDSSKTDVDRLVVLGLTAASNCPWRQRQLSGNSEVPGDSNGREGKEHNFTPPKQNKSAKQVVKTAAESSKGKGKKLPFVIAPLPVSMVGPIIKIDEETSAEKNPSPTGSGSGQLALQNKNNSVQRDRKLKYNAKRRSYDVSLPPCPISSSGGDSHDRSKVRETLRLFNAICRKLLQEEESGVKKQEEGSKRGRIDCQAAKILRDNKKYVNTGKQIIGPVPGVEVGDEFQYFTELNIVGLHRQSQSGIDFVKLGRKTLATSIVASGGYEDDLDTSDVLSYMGQGGNVIQKDKPPEDQKLERGNLALANSKIERNDVRVIRGESSKSSRRYVYDGLYVVEDYKQEPGPHGKLVYKFKLVRKPGQPELASRQLIKSKKSKVREGLCVDDISLGKERMPICAINTVDDEKPPEFEYITSIIYPDWYSLVPPQVCDCIKGCSELKKCLCVMKNRGEIPYNHSGAIVEAKPLVYECGPACKCPPSCHNRVSQHGIKFRLEVFKTESRGWGVRSLNSIPSGSFICEYIGELLEEREAEARTGNDEYLFDIGNNYNDTSLWGELATLMPDAPSSSSQVVEGSGFTIDAAQKGNVGRFINHSCSPNLYAQNVLYDHDDKRIPHIMLFAAENIPPLQELTYHYNYMLDQVFDASGGVG